MLKIAIYPISLLLGSIRTIGDLTFAFCKVITDYLVITKVYLIWLVDLLHISTFADIAC